MKHKKKIDDSLHRSNKCLRNSKSKTACICDLEGFALLSDPGTLAHQMHSMVNRLAGCPLLKSSIINQKTFSSFHS